MKLNGVNALQMVFTASRSGSPGAIRTLRPHLRKLSIADCIVQTRIPPQEVHTAPSDKREPKRVGGRCRGLDPDNRRFKWIDRVVFVFHRISMVHPTNPARSDARVSTTYSASSPKPFSKSAETGKSVASANRARKSAARCCEHLVAEA